MSETNNQKSMMLVVQEHRGMPTFSLIRITESCPFVECIFIPDVCHLALISTIQKDTFHFFPKLDNKGDIIMSNERVAESKTYEEQRESLRTFYEYTLVNQDDIIAFVDRFAVNADSFQYKNLFKVESKKSAKK